jgi:hypothetical protein
MWPPDFSEFQLWSNNMPLLFRAPKDNDGCLSSADCANVELGIVQPDRAYAPRRLVQNQDSAFEPREHDEEAGSAPKIRHALPLTSSLSCDTQKPFQSCIRNRGLEQQESSLLPVRSTSSSAGTIHSTTTSSTIAMAEPPKAYILPIAESTIPLQTQHTGIASFASSSTTLMDKQDIIAPVARTGLPPKKYHRILRNIRWTCLTSVVVLPISETATDQLIASTNVCIYWYCYRT